MLEERGMAGQLIREASAAGLRLQVSGVYVALAGDRERRAGAGADERG
jgi:hypothetical protein